MTFSTTRAPSRPALADELAEGSLDGLGDDAHAGLLVRVGGGVASLVLAGGVEGADEGGSAAGDDAFLDRGAGGVQGVLHTGFLLLHLGLGGSADIDDGHSPGELGKTLLELLTVVVGGGVLDLLADLVDAAPVMASLPPAAFHDGGVFLGDGDALGFTEVGKLDVLELDAEILGDAAAAGEDRRCPRAWPCGGLRIRVP